MEERGQRATSLIETTVAVAIVAAVAGAMLGAVSFAARAAGSDTIRGVLQGAAQREMLVAIDVLKYQGTAIAPVSIATTLPMPTGSPLPAIFSIQTSSLGAGAIAVVITASSSSPAQTATLRSVLTQQAPLPGSRLLEPILVPAPTGAP